MDMIRVVFAKPLSGHRLQVRFSDGTEGIYAVEPERRGGIFQKIIPPDVFNAVRINEDFGCVEWPGDVDLCPTSMHDEVAGSRAPAVAEEVAS